MRRAILGLTVLGGLAALAPRAWSAADVNINNAIGLIDYSRKPNLKVGSWARYRVTGSSESGEAQDYQLTVLIAGEERFWGEDCFWVETWTEDKLGKHPVASLLSYAIFQDSLPLAHMTYYTRKLVSNIDEHGNAVQEITKLASGVVRARERSDDRTGLAVDTLGAETIAVPRGSFTCTKVTYRQGLGTTRDLGDSSIRTENRENRTLYLSREVPLTSLVKEEIETTIARKAWKIGENSEKAPLLTIDRGTSAAVLVDYGEGLTSELVPVQFRKSLRAQDAKPAPKGKTTAKKSG